MARRMMRKRRGSAGRRRRRGRMKIQNPRKRLAKRRNRYIGDRM